MFCENCQKIAEKITANKNRCVSVVSKSQRFQDIKEMNKSARSVSAQTFFEPPRVGSFWVAAFAALFCLFSVARTQWPTFTSVRSQTNVSLISSPFTGLFPVTRRLVLSIRTFTWQSRTNASFIHSIRANTFTQSHTHTHKRATKGTNHTWEIQKCEKLGPPQDGKTAPQAK